MKELEKQGDGLLHSKNGIPLEASADVKLTQGVLEGSNVNAFVAMTEMIELAKNFELQTKVMRNADENSGASARLMQMA
jgi:flagellar basal-body rod protein FlgF